MRGVLCGRMRTSSGWKMSRPILLASLLVTACLNIDGDCGVPFGDGSARCDGGPVEARELEGEWCTADLGTCLRVVHRDSLEQSALYFWTTPDCAEDGILTDGLEFTPDGSGQCFGPTGFYSASADWTDLGLRIFIDGQPRPLELNYNGCPTCN